MCRWFDSAPGHQMQSQKKPSVALGFFIGTTVPQQATNLQAHRSAEAALPFTASRMLIALVDLNGNDSKTVAQACRTGYDCKTYASFSHALKQLEQDDVALVLTGCAPQNAERMQALEALSHHQPQAIPAIVIAHREELAWLPAMLAAGASDYVLAPLRPQEIRARIGIQLERATPERLRSETVRFGDYVFESRQGKISRLGRDIDVTRKEFELALLFFRHLNRPLSRASIQEAVWSNGKITSSRTIDTHVSRVRTKLDLRPENGYRLTPVYSYGYQLETLGC